MTPVFRIVLIVVSLLSTYYILKKIRQSKLQIEYAIFWIVFAGVLVIISLFPWLVTLFTRLLGMQLPVNFVFMVFIFILLLKLFMMTIELSTLENKVKDLTQELALEEKERADELKEKENEKRGNDIRDYQKSLGKVCKLDERRKEYGEVSGMLLCTESASDSGIELLQPSGYG